MNRFSEKMLAVIPRKPTLVVLLLFANLAAPATTNCAPKKKSAPPARTIANAKTKPVEDLEPRIQKLEESLDRIDAEVEILKIQSKLVIQRMNLNYANQTYFRLGLSVLLPRSRTFGFQTDTGLGGLLGIGQYFGRNHIAELNLNWDLYPAVELRYRYEWHKLSPLISFGPIIGYRMKAAGMRPFDNFLANPDAVDARFFVIGMSMTFPLNQSVIGAEMLYLVSSQQLLVGNMIIHFFL